MLRAAAATTGGGGEGGGEGRGNGEAHLRAGEADGSEIHLLEIGTTRGGREMRQGRDTEGDTKGDTEGVDDVMDANDGEKMAHVVVQALTGKLVFCLTAPNEAVDHR